MGHNFLKISTVKFISTSIHHQGSIRKIITTVDISANTTKYVTEYKNRDLAISSKDNRRYETGVGCHGDAHINRVVSARHMAAF